MERIPRPGTRSSSGLTRAAFDPDRRAALDPELEELARKVIGAAIEVHRCLGPGYSEPVYDEAVAIELTLRGIPFERQALFALEYKGHSIGKGRLDFLIAGRLVLELKAVEELAPVHRAQVLSYFQAKKLKLGLLVNFTSAVLKDGIRRVILSSASS
jgi:GxxExxY protein